MLQSLTVFVDADRPQDEVRDYAGYTENELRRGKPAVRV